MTVHTRIKLYEVDCVQGFVQIINMWSRLTNSINSQAEGIYSYTFDAIVYASQ